MPTPIIAHRSSFDCLFQRSPDYHFLRTFGCLCFPFLRPYNNHKLDFRSSLYVCSLVTVPRTLVIDVLTLHLTAFIFPVMFVSMNMCFHLIIMNRLQRSRTHPATVTLPTLLYHPPLPTPNSHHTSALPLQTATLPQPLPLPCPSSYACLSNHYDAGSARQLISSCHPNASPPSLEALSSPSST